VGYDTGQQEKGRKRLVQPDTLGNVLASRVRPADVSDATAAMAFWDEAVATHPLLTQVLRVYGDTPFAGQFAQHLDQHYGCRSPSACRARCPRVLTAPSSTPRATASWH